jgi:glycosyltransferase involved in cell wall biosynthesis
MKKGIIILFTDDEKRIQKNQFINLFNQKEVKLCFVNNGSKDNTLHILESVRDDLESNSITIIDIKKNKGTIAAVKAGARYLLNSGDLKYIMYFKSNMLSYFENEKNQFEILKNMENSFKDRFSTNNSRKNAKIIFSYKHFLTF